MRESDLYPVLRRWLERHGWSCYAEVCCFSGPWPTDVVAQRGRSLNLLAVEMKTGFTGSLLRQGSYLSMFALYPYVAAPTKPREAFLEDARRIGVGVLRIGEDVAVIQKPRISHHRLWWHFWQSALKEIGGYGEFHSRLLAGVPNGRLGEQIALAD